ncbi:MAG TPA: 5'/3'-nucleotidase SurE [Gemmatimonadales bacterium]|nr:5'/3'-nucleotidase SurE [Gemmatimonadales bacterium]
MRLLLVNDDGVYSPGLLALAKVARRFGEVRVVAPDVEQSSMGQAITYTRPLTIKRTPLGDLDAWRVNGTPADCAALGLNAWSDVTAVLSGINLGLNLGNSAWHSGTLAAARQAVLLGCRGVALSSAVGEAEPDFAVLEPYLERALQLLLAPNAPQLVNVNFPLEPEGLYWTHLSIRHYDGQVVPGKDPQGRAHYWLTIRPIEDVEPESDRWAVRHQFVSLTPLRLDLTDEDALRRLKREPLD